MSKKIYQVFTGCNILAITLEHNGFQGGDAGRGGFVRLNMTDLGGTCMKVNGKDCDSFELEFGGDSERDTFLRSLKMVVKELEQNKNIE